MDQQLHEYLHKEIDKIENVELELELAGIPGLEVAQRMVYQAGKKRRKANTARKKCSAKTCKNSFHVDDAK